MKFNVSKKKIMLNKCVTDKSQEMKQTSIFSENTYALPERAKKGSPTNKYMSVRNIKAQVANMSVNENAGFKSEYHVRILFSLYTSQNFLYFFFYWNHYQK